MVYGNGAYVAVGDYGTILYSTNLQDWAVTESPTDAFLNRVIYAQGKFVAVGGAGTILWSSNGVSWSEAAVVISEDLFSVTYGNDTFVAAGDFGSILSSGDGVHWTQEISGTFAPIYDLAWNGEAFIAAGYDPGMLISWDGRNWETAIESTLWFPRVAAANHVFVSTFANGVIVSSNGLSWQRVNLWSDPNYVISDGSKFITYEWGATFTSPDGLAWTRHATTNGPGNSVCYGPLGYVMVGDSGFIQTSSDGIHWNPRNINRWLTHSQMALGNGKLVCVDRWFELVAFTLGNGALEEPVTPGGELKGDQIVFGNGFFLLGGYNGYRKSTDGTNWSEPYGSVFQSLRFVNGWFWGIDGSHIFRSADGVNWEPRGTDLPAWFNDLAYGNGVYVAVGNSGGIFTSADDGESWSTTWENTNSFSLNRIVFGNGKFLCTAEYRAYSSVDGANWQTNALPFPAYSLHFAGGYFLAVGYNHFATSTDAIHWTVRHPTPSFSLPAKDVAFDGASVWMLLGLSLVKSDALTGAPLVLSQPASRTNAPGSSATFNIQVTGEGPITYQWQKNGTNIVGATNATLTLNPVTGADAGMYTVVVTNPAGTLVGGPASLVVESDAAPVLSVQRLAAVMIEGKVGRMYQIQSSPVLGSGASWQTLTNVVLPSSPYMFIDLGSANGQRFYRAVLMP